MKTAFVNTHRMSRINSFISATIISLALFLLAGNTNSIGETMPFRDGERLRFRAQWGIINAGEATLEVLPAENIKGVPLYHFRMITETNKYVDLFYKIRERQDSYVDREMTHSVLYRKKSEGEHPRDVVVDFDWENKTSSYSSFGEKMPPVSISAGTFDPLALFYVIRLHELTEGKVIEIPVTDGKRFIPATARVLKKETITIMGDRYETFRVESGLEEIGGKDQSGLQDNITIWFTADKRKLPFRMKFKKGIADFTFEIVSSED